MGKKAKWHSSAATVTALNKRIKVLEDQLGRASGNQSLQVKHSKKVLARVEKCRDIARDLLRELNSFFPPNKRPKEESSSSEATEQSDTMSEDGEEVLWAKSQPGDAARSKMIRSLSLSELKGEVEASDGEEDPWDVPIPMGEAEKAEQVMQQVHWEDEVPTGKADKSPPPKSPSPEY